MLLPPGYAKEPNRRYPVLYYLHGLGDNEQMLLRSGGFDLVQGLYRRYLGRDADDGGLGRFTRALGHGARDEDLVAAILGSAEYLER